MLVKIVDDIDIKEAYDYLQSPDTGAVNLFIGTVRNHTKGKEVLKLVFEAYDKMALKEMNKLAAAAKSKWPLDKLLILHITGEKKPGDAVVRSTRRSTLPRSRASQSPGRSASAVL